MQKKSYVSGISLFGVEGASISASHSRWGDRPTQFAVSLRVDHFSISFHEFTPFQLHEIATALATAAEQAQASMSNSLLIASEK